MKPIAFEKHLPQLFLDQLGRHDAADSFTVRLPAAVMLTDISGFSALTLSLTSQGTQGLETLQQILDGYFGALGAVITRYGGDICTFAGDAVVAAWPDHDGSPAAVQKAVACALRIQQDAPSWFEGQTLELSQRIAVSDGELLISKIGGAQGKWLNVFAGKPVVEAGRACDITTPGQVLVTASVAGRLQGLAQMQPAAGDCHRVHAVSDDAAALSAATPPASVSTTAPGFDPMTLAGHVPEILVRRARAGQDDWLAEFRAVTALFVKLDEASLSAADSHAALQGVSLAVQQVVQRFGGALPYAQMDDKGLNFIVAFGIPTASYEDDAARALSTALEIQRQLRALGLRPSIGLSTGWLYCGECGAEHRRQYSMIGPAMNFAARLAGAAVDDLLCDEETSKAAGNRMSFTIAQNVLPKHAEATVLAFRPVARLGVSERVNEMVGRRQELAQLLDSLKSMNEGRGARWLVRGEPGIGKSRLLAALREQAQAAGVKVVFAEAESLERHTPYFIWRELLGQLLRLLRQGEQTPAQSLLQRLQDAPQLLSWAPLLNDILPLAPAETDLTREMRGAARASSLQALLQHLVLAATEAGPLLMIVNDLHWVDALSVEALQTLEPRVPALGLVLATRPQTGSDSGTDAAAAGWSERPTIELGALSSADTADMVGQLCGVATAPTELSTLIHGRAEGNPFYIQQLTLALREAACIEVVGGRCQTKGDVAAHLAHALPGTLRGVIVSRVDRLNDEQQLLLKLASVFGRVFSLAGLAAIYPVTQTLSRIQSLLASLAGSSFVHRQSGTDEDRYAFEHAIAQEAIYELLPMAQRRRQHGRIADWLEQQHSGLMAGFFGVLAKHCLLAEEFGRALNHLEGGARTAFRQSAYREAIGHLETAQRVVADKSIAANEMRRASWQLLMGDSHHELSEYQQAEKQYLSALALAGQPRSPASLGKPGGLIRELMRLGLRQAPATAESTDAAAGSPLSLAAHAYSRLAEITYHQNKPLALLHLTLLSYNEAARARSIPELSAAHGSLAIAWGQMGLPGVARRSAQRATRLAEARPSDVNGVAYAHLLAMVHASSQCDWPVMDHSGAQSESLYAALGDGFRQASAQALLSTSWLQRSDIAAVQRVLQRMDPYLRDGAPARVRGWALDTQMQIAMLKGEVVAADIEALAQLGQQIESPIDRLMHFGTAASAWLRLGRHERALESARAGLDLLSGQTPVAGAGYVYGPLGVVEALLAAWGRAGAAGTEAHAAHAAHAASAALACSKLRVYTQQVPSTRPRGNFLLAWYAELLGEPSRAIKLWQRAASEAIQLGMPYDQAVALQALAQRQPGAAKQGQQARQIFESLGVPPPTLAQPG